MEAIPKPMACLASKKVNSPESWQSRFTNAGKRCTSQFPEESQRPQFEEEFGSTDAGPRLPSERIHEPQRSCEWSEHEYAILPRVA
jgi:hypothetical protein